ncbi:MAG: sensor histidine kinase [Candidatus Faecivicinus sp.]
MKRKSRAATVSITVKLLALLLPLMLAILLIFGNECNTLYADMISEEITGQIQLQLDSVAARINSQISELNRISLFIYANQDLRDGLSCATLDEEAFTAVDRLSLYSDVIQPMFHVVTSPSQYMMILYPASEKVFCDYYYVQPLDNFPDTLPLQDMIEQGFAHTFCNIAMVRGNYTRPQPALVMTRVIYGSGGTLLGVLNTVIWISRLEAAIQTILPESGDCWYSCSLADGQTVFQSGELRGDMLQLSADVDRIGASLSFGLNTDVISAQTREQNRIFAVFTAATLAMAAAAIAVTSSLIMRRLRYVLNKYIHFPPGHALQEDALEGWDEAARLDQTFTHLYREYYASVQAQQQMKIDQRNLENSLLLSRINPHFLYNTLSAIRWKLPQEEWEIIDSLVAFYRGILGKGVENAPVYAESELMKQYVDLYCYTYSRNIEFTESLAPDAMVLLIPKFLLQPVFENAIQHSGENQALHIDLRVWCEDGRLIMTVTNDGTPIAPQIMGHLNALNGCESAPALGADGGAGEPHGYAIFNIISRIRLLFGEGYGLWYGLSEEGNTQARFVLPACATREQFDRRKVR